MLPWGHLGVGYLCYTLASRQTDRYPSQGAAVLLLAVGTQFPDLVDKPLAWQLGVLPSGRGVAHSFLVALVLSALLILAGRQVRRLPEAIAFAVGYVTHILGDAVPVAIATDWNELSFLSWPVTSFYEYPNEIDRSILEYLLTPDRILGNSLDILVFALAAVMWMRDGTPGVRLVLHWLGVGPRPEQTREPDS
ncbi:LexA-binding, inner membrane-associated putative hydrolase [Halovenus aranensis]|uniref:LexA-binding, inner membrane-associated putative hydrolase n=1 Tax=Halovenus aranensis TaxID=890420 RepID=A0A1G8Z8T8_9EURY|nr:metal-dependent hydrolase [Halovenus aranensis]SDK11471.1 LexA-binding, inner membrane-associated putative hydrolase [Halovenus aranensis]